MRKAILRVFFLRELGYSSFSWKLGVISQWLPWLAKGKERGIDLILAKGPRSPTGKLIREWHQLRMAKVCS